MEQIQDGRKSIFGKKELAQTRVVSQFGDHLLGEMLPFHSKESFQLRPFGRVDGGGKQLEFFEKSQLLAVARESEFKAAEAPLLIPKASSQDRARHDHLIRAGQTDRT